MGFIQDEVRVDWLFWAGRTIDCVMASQNFKAREDGAAVRQGTLPCQSRGVT